jgi:hypothetical protein
MTTIHQIEARRFSLGIGITSLATLASLACSGGSEEGEPWRDPQLGSETIEAATEDLGELREALASEPIEPIARDAVPLRVPRPPIPTRHCFSSVQCPESHHCSVDEGDCMTQCPPGRVCHAACAGECVPDDERPELQCGDVTCERGTYCCNASCGLCAPPGRLCTQRACDEE